MPAAAEATNGKIEIGDVYDIASMGEGVKFVRRETLEFTVEAAENFLTIPEFIVNDVKVDRERSNSHIVYLSRAMLNGTFLWEQVNLVVCTLDGRKYRLNGNHTSWARSVAAESGLPAKTRAPVQICYYAAKTMEDMRRLYASLDRGKPRSTANVINSYLAGTEDFPDYPKAILKHLAAGLGIWMWQDPTQRSLYKGDERAFLLLKDHHKTALGVGVILKESQGGPGKHLSRAPVVAAMFETCQKAPQVAYDFWRDVRDGLGITDRDDPHYVLRNYLLTTSLSKGQFNGDMKIVTQEEMFRACVYKWNDFRSGRKSKSVRVDLSVARPKAQ